MPRCWILKSTTHRPRASWCKKTILWVRLLLWALDHVRLKVCTSEGNKNEKRRHKVVVVYLQKAIHDASPPMGPTTPMETHGTSHGIQRDNPMRLPHGVTRYPIFVSSHWVTPWDIPRDIQGGISQGISREGDMVSLNSNGVNGIFFSVRIMEYRYPMWHNIPWDTPFTHILVRVFKECTSGVSQTGYSKRGIHGMNNPIGIHGNNPIGINGMKNPIGIHRTSHEYPRSVACDTSKWDLSHAYPMLIHQNEIYHMGYPIPKENTSGVSPWGIYSMRASTFYTRHKFFRHHFYFPT